MIKIAIIGGTGYTGVELLRLLARHPEADVQAISSRTENGRSVADLFPSLRGHFDLELCVPEDIGYAGIDLVFFATPHGIAQAQMPQVLESGVRAIDLSADFRLRDRGVWEHWYAQTHASPGLVAEAVYGLPELNRQQIADARLVACPGCYPTSILLGLAPLLREPGMVNPLTLVANAASGTSGAGRQATIHNLYAEVGDSFQAYAVDGHRHLPEIEQYLERVADRPVHITFVPHLLPVNRGILATIYADLPEPDATDFQALFERDYAHEPFVDVLPQGMQPTLRSVRGTNMCRISVCRPQGRDKLVITSVVDNLTKGASGQAVQNMNIMFGLDEAMGLESVALVP